jgi:hypothetical protein
MKFILALGILLAACGTQAPGEQATALVAQKAATQETTTAPTATDGAAGAPAIIQQTEVTPGEVCPAGGVRFTSWVDYAQDAAKDGTPTFTPGIDQGFATRVLCAGVDGQDGKDGVDGATGQAGAQGVAGAAGAPGADGEDGVGLPSFQVVDGAGVVVGNLVWVNPANSDYWVQKGDLRMQFSRVIGHFPLAYTFCSAADCTGTCKLAITNGFFANTFLIYETGIPVRATGRAQAASFAYASRRMGSSCTNTPGSTTGLFDMAPLSTGDLGFAYPIVGAEALNTAGGVQ